MMRLSSLPKTWIFDIDGTLVVHNGYKSGKEELLPGVKEFFLKLSPNDYVLLLTARKEDYKKQTIEFLKKNNIRYNKILFDIPTGERILVNDDKPSGLSMGYVVNKKRNESFEVEYEVDEKL